MKNIEIIDYINNQLNEKFNSSYLEYSRYLNENSSSFSAKYSIGDISVIFVKDRGWLEVEILKNNKFTMIEKLNPNFKDLKFSLENINKVTQYLDVAINHSVKNINDDEEE